MLHLPLARRAPWFTAGVWCSQAAYYLVHKQSHRDAAWAKRWVPWHYDHHMGPNQHANWGVTWPLWDHILGTREPYVGTERQRAEQQGADELHLRLPRGCGGAGGDGGVQEEAPDGSWCAEGRVRWSV